VSQPEIFILIILLTQIYWCQGRPVYHQCRPIDKVVSINLVGTMFIAFVCHQIDDVQYACIHKYPQRQITLFRYHTHDFILILWNSSIKRYVATILQPCKYLEALRNGQVVARPGNPERRGTGSDGEPDRARREAHLVWGWSWPMPQPFFAQLICIRFQYVNGSAGDQRREP